MRVLIVDDHEEVRRGIRDLVRGLTGFDLCGEACNGMLAVSMAKEQNPDIILMDVSMPEMNGIAATREIKRLLPSTRIFILSNHDFPQLREAGYRAGASAYIKKTEVWNELVMALRAAQPQGR